MELNSSSRTLFLFVLLFVLGASFSSAQNTLWKTTPEELLSHPMMKMPPWVAYLEEFELLDDEEKSVTIIFLRGRFNIKMDRVAKANPQDFDYVMKVHTRGFCGMAHLASVAGLQAWKNYLIAECENAVNLVRGNSTQSEYAQLSKNNKVHLDNILKDANQDRIIDIYEENKALIDNMAGQLLGYASLPAG